MKIENRSIRELKPYAKNPRRNDEAVKYVAESIRQFGFKVPMVVDRDGVIVCGHTRYEAAKLLGIDEVPCVIADDLTPKQIKAFRLADNKVAEKAEWDFDLLDEEIMNIGDEFDLEALGFEFDEQDPFDEPKQNARLNTDKAYKLPFVNLDRCDGFYQMPILTPCSHIPTSLTGFNYAMSSTNFDTGIHFYIDDYQFERVWNDPKRYIDILQNFECCLTPDFSLYSDMPRSMKIWNVFRSRLIGQIMQDVGIPVIPTVSWAEPETFDFCFDGLPSGSVLSISTIGVKRSEEAMKMWRAGVDELIRRKSPAAIVVYGGEVDYNYDDVKTYYYENGVTERMKNGKN